MFSCLCLNSPATAAERLLVAGLVTLILNGLFGTLWSSLSVEGDVVYALTSMGNKCLILLVRSFDWLSEHPNLTTAARTCPSFPAINFWTTASFQRTLFVESFCSTTTSPTEILGVVSFLELAAWALCKFSRQSCFHVLVNWLNRRFW